MLKNKPEIRFTEFKNDWVHQSLNKVAERVIRKNKNNQSKVPLTISAQYGLVDQVTYFNKQIASTDLSNYFLLQKGDFAYNKSYSKDYPWGAIKRLDKYEEGVLSSLYIVFKPTRVHSDFLVQYYETSRWYKEVSMRATEGARNHGLLNISASDFLETELSIPFDFEEQKKIGIFFKNLNDAISLHQQELEALKQTKQGFLQKMFPRDGESIPKLRFPEFISEWHSTTLNNVTNIIGGGTPDTKESKYWDGEIDWYSPTEIGKNTYANGSARKITQLGLEKSSAKLLPANKTILFTSRAGIGDTAILIKDGATNQGFQSLVVQDNCDVYFLYSMSHKIKNYALKNASGSTFLEISGKNLGKMPVLIPTIEEQVKIGEFFRQLDEVIELKRKELEVLKETKKGFLQKMFV